MDTPRYSRYPETTDPLDELVEDTRPLIASGEYRYKQRMHALQAEHTGSDTQFLDKAEEQNLMTTIQAGLASAAFLDTFTREDYQALPRSQKATIEDALRQHIHTVVEGRRARNTLVENNLRFAADLARQSMNIFSAPKDIDDEDETPKRSRKLKPIDGRLDITKLATDRASLEDRTQIANLALIKAAEKAKPGRGAKFLTYAAWHIYAALNVEAIEAEQGGARVPIHTRELINATQAHPEDFDDAKIRALQLYNSRGQSVPLDDLPDGAIAPEEISSDWDEPSYLTSADIIADTRLSTTPQPSIEADQMRQDISHILDSTLAEREAGVIRHRNGFGDGEPRTLDDVGHVYGVSKERIRQIESKTMSKLRHPYRSQPLRDYLPLSPDPAEYATAINDGDAFAALRTPNASQYNRSRPLMLPRAARPPRESWQLYADEPWDMPEHQAHGSYERGWFDLLVAMRVLPSHLESASAPEFAQTAFEIIIRATKSTLTAGHVEEYWNTRIEAFVHMQPPDVDDFDHVGLLFSRLLRETMSLEDTVKLTVPESLDGKIHFLGHDLQAGTIEVDGSLGEYAGYNMGGASRLIVHGSVGACAANRLHDIAEIIVDGDAGKRTGNGAYGGAIIDVKGTIASLDVNPALNMDVTAGKIDIIDTKAPLLPPPFDE